MVIRKSLSVIRKQVAPKPPRLLSLAPCHSSRVTARSASPAPKAKPIRVNSCQFVDRNPIFVIRYPLSVNGKPFAPKAQLITRHLSLVTAPTGAPVSGLPHGKACSRLLPLVTRHASLVTRHRAQRIRSPVSCLSPLASRLLSRVTRHQSPREAPPLRQRRHHSPFKQFSWKTPLI